MGWPTFISILLVANFSPLFWSVAGLPAGTCRNVSWVPLRQFPATEIWICWQFHRCSSACVSGGGLLLADASHTSAHWTTGLRSVRTHPATSELVRTFKLCDSSILSDNFQECERILIIVCYNLCGYLPLPIIAEFRQIFNHFTSPSLPPVISTCFKSWLLLFDPRYGA